MKSYKRRLILIFCGIVVAALAGFALLNPYAFMSPREVVNQFKLGKNATKEETIMDPLILKGPSTIPVLLEEVKNPEMRYRVYALGYLGYAKAQGAAPLLVHIITNKSEHREYRLNAFASLVQIDHARAKAVAEVLDGDNQLQSEETRYILEWYSRGEKQRRSYLKALLRHVD